MSRSYHTDPKWRIAARNAKSDRDGTFLLPRIIERAPRVGDIHPVAPAKLRAALQRLPLELWHGVRAIELRARVRAVGKPFGCYAPRSKTIRLYSLPPVLELAFIPSLDRELMEVSGGRIEKAEKVWRVWWDEPSKMRSWFFFSTVIHELGHHHRSHYPAKTGLPRRFGEEEFLAERYCDWVLGGRMSKKKYPVVRRGLS